MAIYILIFSAFCVSVLLSRIIIPRILVVAFRKRLFDVPDARKVHTGVVPRLGGISFMPTILFSVCFVTAVGLMLGEGSGGERLMANLPEFFLLQCGLTLLYLTGVKDDLVGLRYKAKFVIQILCACLIPLSGVWINNFYGLFGLGAIPAHYQRHQPDRRYRRPGLGIEWGGVAGVRLPLYGARHLDLRDGLFRHAGGFGSLFLLQRVRAGGPGPQDLYGRHGQPDAGLPAGLHGDPLLLLRSDDDPLRGRGVDRGLLDVAGAGARRDPGGLLPLAPS